MGTGETKGMGQGQVRVHRGANRDEGVGWGSPGRRVKGWWVTVGGQRGKSGGKFRCTLRPADHTGEVAEGCTKRLIPCALAGTLTYNVCFTYPLFLLYILCCLCVPVVFR